jgi:hypothetical protein
MTPERRAACAGAVHVYTTEGEWIRAGRAWLFTLERCGWPVTARVLRLPPMIWLLEAGYIVVARNRPVFARFLFRGYSSERVGPPDDLERM